jgi:eukaryotic-like serine/threonine-protein kinase
MYQITSAINYCHSLSIAHRDLKPENIFMTNDNDILLADFGASKNVEDFNQNHTMIGTVIFFFIFKKMNYMAPEISKNNNNYDVFKTDIYSIGHIFFNLLTLNIQNQLDFKIESFRKLLDNIKNLDSFKFKNQILNIILKCLDLNPENRFNSLELFDEIKKLYFHFFNSNDELLLGKVCFFKIFQKYQ